MGSQQHVAPAAAAVAGCEALARDLAVPPLWARLLWQRGIHDAETFREVIGKPAALGDPAALPDLPAAADLLRRAIRDGARIRVHGDYDADGVTATAIMVRALHRLAPASAVDWHVPSRFDEGYGVSLDAVWRAHQAGVRVMITVDCGTSAPEAARLADSLGLTLLVTDHHRLPAVLPAVPALVNPERMTRPQILSGAGVALQLARYLLQDEAPPVLWGLAAVGTVADVVPLVRDSRAVAQQGLAALAAGAVPGVAALLDRARRDVRTVTARDLAFSVGPRLNAAGRMGDPAPAVELCLADDGARGDVPAARLEALNQERRRVELSVRTAAMAEVDQRRQLPAFIVVSGRWHEGVIGIVAARLTERYRRPAAVISLGEGSGKGSARSGGTGDLAGALAEVARHFTKWGGHPGAAGFSLAPGGLAGLEDELAALWQDRWGTGSVPQPTVDAEVPVSALTPDLARFLAQLEPFGHGFEAPRFRVAGLVVESTTMGAGQQHLRLKLAGERVGSVGFGLGAHAADLEGRWLVGRAGLSLGQYRGREQVQIRWEAVEEPPGPPGPLEGNRWEWGRPPDAARALVLVGSARARARLAPTLPPHWQASSWWRPDLAAGTGPAWTALWIHDAPPHAAALRSAVGQLVADGVVYWEERALSGAGVLAKWARLVPDRVRLLALWQSRRASRRGLVPGGRVLQDLGLDGGEVPASRRALEDSGRWVAARHEHERAQRDWLLGGPLIWREHMKGATGVSGTWGEEKPAGHQPP